MNISNDGLAQVSARQKQQNEQQKFISSFHLVIWLFAVSYEISDDYRRRIRKMYGEAQHMVQIVIRKKEVFQETMNQIKKSNKDCLVKIFLDQEMYRHLKDLCQKEEKISDIYLWKTTERFNQDIFDRSPKLKPIKPMLTFEEALLRAERQVEKWTKPYKTFKNHNQLIDFDKQQNINTINRFRYTLISFINMRNSDFQQALKGFRGLVYSEINILEAHLSNLNRVDKKGQYYKSMANRLVNYQIAAQKFHEALKHQNNQSQKQDFYNYVMNFYQEQCFFYHIFNSNLKMIGSVVSKDTSVLTNKRKELMLPFNHVYNSIKWLFRKEIQKKNKAYTKSFQTYRFYRSKVSQLNQLKEKLRKMEQNKDSLFIEFYAPISTSQSAQIAFDKFAFLPLERSEKQVILKIKVNSITQYPKFLEEKNNIFLHGFFKMSKKQNNLGLSELQVLFNALNIFKVVRIYQTKISDFFSQAKQQILKKKQKLFTKQEKTSDKYRIQNTHQEELYQYLTVIELEFGPFYNVLMEANESKLGHNQRKARQNYLSCINKIGKYNNKFDYTDSCVILNDLDECYQILINKVQSNDFAVSVKDGKNYFQQLAKVCRLLGRVTEAVKYTNLAIECHTQLEQVHLCDVYNTHYDKLYDMQLNAVAFYQQVSQLGIAEKMLKKMMDEMKSRQFEHAKSKVRESQVIMNMGINYYSRGKLDKSKIKFQECKLQLQKFIRNCIHQPRPSYYCCSYLWNLLCGGSTRQCDYDEYGERLRLDLVQQRFRKNGSREEINQSRDKANTMLELISAALKNQRLFFQNQAKYQSLIRSNQFDRPQRREGSKLNVQELQTKIRDCIVKITKIDDSTSPKYTEYMNQLLSFKEQIEKIEINFFFEGKVDTHINEYIKKFLKKEPKRREKEFDKKRKIVKQAQKQKLLQQYAKCAQDIKRNIQQLRKEGFVQSTNDILKERNNLAIVLEKSQQRQEALKEIKKIIDSKIAQDDSRFLEHATAYFTKGRIQMEINQIVQAIQSFDNSLEQYQKFWRMTIEKQKLMGKEIDQDPNFKQSDHNNEFQLIKITRMKAKLKLAQQKNLTRSKQKIFNQVQSEILEIMDIINCRDPLQDSVELKSSLNEVHIHFKLNRTPYQNHKEGIFYLLNEMIDLNGKDSSKNILALCQLISSFHTVGKFLVDIRGSPYVQILKTAKKQCKDADVDIQWKILKAFYYLQISNKDVEGARQCLKQTILILQRLVKDNKNKKHLKGELQYLQKIESQKMSEMQATLSTKLQSTHQIIRIHQNRPNSNNQLIPKPK